MSDVGASTSGGGAPVLVVAVGLKRDFLPKDEVRGRVLGLTLKALS